MRHDLKEVIDTLTRGQMITALQWYADQGLDTCVLEETFNRLNIDPLELQCKERLLNDDSAESVGLNDHPQNVLQQARSKAHSAVNSAMVEAYWLIGKRIVEEEQNGEVRAQYGKRILENLSTSLSGEFGKGFSYANLRNFRQFYLTYPDQEICYTVCSKLSWSHNRLIM